MKRITKLAALALAAALLPAAANGQDRYAERPPLVVSPDLAAPWVMQLRRAPQGGVAVRNRQVLRRLPDARVSVAPAPVVRTRRAAPVVERRVETVAVAPAPARKTFDGLEPVFLPQQVAYEGPHAPGTIVIDTSRRFLYLVQEGDTARRYGVGVGKEGFGWTGTERITNKREWPDWRPPAAMIERERAKGRILPAHMPGGPANPLGARALYLGSTLYRIHGTNAPWTIGRAVSSGCIRMRNEDVIDLYGRVRVGTKVVVI